MVQRKTNFLKPTTPDDFKVPIDYERARHLSRQDNAFALLQDTAASGTFPLGVARRGGQIVAVRCLIAGDVAASGESMTIDIAINGTTALSGVMTLNNATGRATWVIGDDTITNRLLALGDYITATLTYTAGGGPTPMTGTYVEVDVEYLEQ